MLIMIDWVWVKVLIFYYKNIFIVNSLNDILKICLWCINSRLFNVVVVMRILLGNVIFRKMVVLED